MYDKQRVPTEELQRLYLAAPTDDAALLDALLSRTQDAVRQRLARHGVTREDLEDCHAETMARLCQAAQKSRSEPQKAIENYPAYALKVADRVFQDYMRIKRPNWRRLKRQILYLLKGKSGGALFHLWKQNLHWLGGFARWCGRPFQPTPRYQTLQENAERFQKQVLENRGAEQVPLPELLALLFRYIETPLELDELTGHIAALRQMKEQEVLSLDGAGFAGESGALARRAESEDMAEAVLNALTNETFQANLWRILCDLPLPQRSVLLLAMTREMLLLMALASPVADALEIPFPAFAALWPQLPLPDAAIAARLNLTVKQVQNLRVVARRRILRHLAKQEETV